MNKFCAKKGIKREFSVARTTQQNGVAERKNRILIEAARTMLADSLLPIPFWAEAVNTACYVLNRVLVTKLQNKTPSPTIPIPDSILEGSGGNHGECLHKEKIGQKEIIKKKWMQKEFVSKQGRKSAKSTPTAHTDQVFDDVDVNDAMDYMETDAYMQKGVSTEDQVSSTAEPKDGTLDESTAPTTAFRDDETIAEFLKPLPKNDPKDKGKKVLEEEAESYAESEGVDEAKRKFDQLAKDEEIAKKVQEDWEAEEEMKKLVLALKYVG
ncbi:retrovirus-related pol polyprotein from transposon TNT 1-94 [Tanacetum coccineum]